MIFGLHNKIDFLLKYPKWLYPQLGSTIFPNDPVPSIKIWARLFGAKNEHREARTDYNLGSYFTKPEPLAIESFRYFLSENPNHLGDRSVIQPQYGSSQLEYEVIQKMQNLYRAKGLRGYVTYGGTEGNLFCTKLGKEYLKQRFCLESICLLRTNLTHYSISKAAETCEVKQVEVPVDGSSWSISIDALKNSLEDLIKSGMRGFLIPLTIGYTSTGTKDDIIEVIKTVNFFKKKIDHIDFFIWIDAAFDGLVLPFMGNFKPFCSPLIKAIVVDFHKYAGTPFPSGLVLYRKTFRKYIAKQIDYLHEKDDTIIGSRTGVSAVSIWTSIHHFGKSGYRKIISNQSDNKDYFLNQLKNKFPKSEIISRQDSLVCGVIFHDFIDQRLPRSIEHKYWLFTNKSLVTRYHEKNFEGRIYRFIFLPHVKRSILMEFIKDLSVYAKE